MNGDNGLMSPWKSRQGKKSRHLVSAILKAHHFCPRRSRFESLARKFAHREISVHLIPRWWRDFHSEVNHDYIFDA